MTVRPEIIEIIGLKLMRLEAMGMNVEAGWDALRAGVKREAN